MEGTKQNATSGGASSVTEVHNLLLCAFTVSSAHWSLTVLVFTGLCTDITLQCEANA